MSENPTSGFFKKAGKTPMPTVAEEPTIQEHLLPDFLEVDSAIKADIEKKKQEYRWVDAKENIANGGFDRDGWQAYRIAKDITLQETSLLGNDPTGIVRRGSLVLAVRPIVVGDIRRKELEARNARYRNIAKKQMDQMEQAARKVGVSTERYEDGEDE